METLELFLRARPGSLNLEEIAVTIFHCLGITNWEERLSANYPPDEHYFSGYAENATIQISDCDWFRFEEYTYHASISEPTSWRTGTGIVEKDPLKIVERLVKVGFTVFIPKGNFFLHGWDGDGDIYTPS